MTKYWIGVLLCVVMVDLAAQTISGHVYDQINHEPLVGATVKLASASAGTSTDTFGYYTISDLEPGRYALEVSFVGYETGHSQEVWVKAGIVTVQDVYLTESARALSEVAVTASRNVMQPGRLEITEEQVNRFASTYYDPARLATTSPDVVITNDQNNLVSVRGLSPVYNTWRLEDAEIVNPNHLSNAGTFLDQPSATGGGVNMLSAQMLSSSELLYGSYGSQYGNSIGGIFNMKLKNGNASQRQFTAQASFIGFDLASDGPLTKGSKVTYSANYRYSFTGLLTAFGVDFGGESIKFQDLALSVNIPMGSRSALKFFGVGGLSSNDFSHSPSSDWETEKDSKDIFYDNHTAVMGARFTSGWGSAGISSTLAYSLAHNGRNEWQYDISDMAVDSLFTKNNLNLLSWNSELRQKLGHANLQVGAMLNGYHLLSRFAGETDEFFTLFRPYATLDGRLGSYATWSAGVSAPLSSDAVRINPRVSISRWIGKYQSIAIGAGRYSQVIYQNNYLFSAPLNVSYQTSLRNLQDSYRLTLSHQLSARTFSLNTEAFYYWMPDVHVYESANQDARTYGISVLMNRSFAENFYLRMGGSLFDSQVGDEENPYNAGYNLTMAGGKEWQKTKKGQQKAFSVNMRGLYQGGKPNQLVVYDGTNSTSIGPYTTKPYVRVDLRLQWTRYRAGSTSSLAFDLQNVAGIQNESYRYYDTFTGKVETQYQLGLTPVLAYRVEW